MLKLAMHEHGCAVAKQIVLYGDEFCLMVRACPGHLSGLSISLWKYVVYVAFVWARRALNSPKWRFLARAGDAGGHTATGVLGAAGQQRV